MLSHARDFSVGEFDVLPATYIALSILIISYCNHCAIGFQSNSVTITRTDGCNYIPSAGNALGIIIISHSYNCAINFKTDCVSSSCTDYNTVSPIVAAALKMRIASHRNYGSIRF